MECSAAHISSNTCNVDINKVLGIKWANSIDYNAAQANDPNLLVQDIFLTATMMIGTVVTLILVISWVRYIMAWGDMANTADAKKWIKNAIIWLVIVTFSYTIVRVIQYIVAWYR